MPSISRHDNYATSPGTSRVPAWQWEDLMGEESQVFVRIDSIVQEWGCWPPSRFFPDVVDQVGGQTIFTGAGWGPDIRWQGGRTMWGVVGVTRDVYGTPLPDCTVKLFRALDDTLQYQVTSDANGYFTLLTPYTDGHYVAAFKSGAPDVQGVTVKTLVPA